MNKQRSLRSIVKIGQKEFMDNFLNKGELYLNTIEYFRENQNNEVGDNWENIFKLAHGKVSLFNMKTNQWEFLHKNNEPIRFSELSSNKNIYCMYGVFLENFIEKDEYRLLEIPDELINNFGGTVINIVDPMEFFDRIKIALRNLGITYNIDMVRYYNPEEYNGDLNEFNKRDNYSHQNEIRVSVSNINNTPLKFYIGPITDIAIIVTNKMIKYADDVDYIVKFNV